MTRRTYAEQLTRRTRAAARPAPLSRWLDPAIVERLDAGRELDSHVAIALGTAARVADDVESEGLAWLTIAEVLEALNGQTIPDLPPPEQRRPRYDRIRRALERLEAAGAAVASHADEDPREGELVYRLTPLTDLEAA